MKRKFAIVMGVITAFAAGMLADRFLHRATPTLPRPTPSTQDSSRVHFTSGGQLGLLTLEVLEQLFQSVAAAGCSQLQVDDVLFEIPDHVGIQLMEAPAPLANVGRGSDTDAEVARYLKDNEPAWCFIWGPPDRDFQSVLHVGRLCRNSGVQCAFFVAPHLKGLQVTWVSRDPRNFLH